MLTPRFARLFVEEMQRMGKQFTQSERLQVFLKTDEEEDPAQLLSDVEPLFDAYLEERMIEALGPESRWLPPRLSITKKLLSPVLFLWR